MSGMAEVLAAHGGTEEDTLYCKAEGCWWYYEPEGDLPELIASHQEDMLTAAGFGPVKGEKRLMELAALMAYDAVEEGALREAKAAALEEAADLVASEESEQWRQAAEHVPGAQIVAQRMQVMVRILRARAATVEGEG